MMWVGGSITARMDMRGFAATRSALRTKIHFDPEGLYFRKLYDETANMATFNILLEHLVN